MPTAVTSIVTLAQVKRRLNWTSTATTDDVELQEFIDGAVVVVESIVGSVVSKTWDEWYDGGQRTVQLNRAPVAAVTSVTETFGANVIRTLTLQALDGVTAVDAYGYTIDNETGSITRRVSGIAAPFASGHRNVHVVYEAGRASVPANIVQGTLELVRFNWAPQRGGNRPGASRGGVDDPGFQVGNYFVPYRVQAQLDASRSNWGIA